MVLSGVGGQGVILASRVLAETALEAGYDVKTSEVHGMAQRGGSVVSMVRWSEKVFSPLVPAGKADFLVAFELLEGWRETGFLSQEGIIVANDHRIDPLPVARGDMDYPSGLKEKLIRRARKCLVLEARKLALEAGNVRTAGICLLGGLSVFLDLPAEAWRESIARLIPSRFLEANLKAFALGREEGSRFLESAGKID